MVRLAVFRADASPTIGGGHLMRCLTLAEALQTAGFRCVFAVASETLASLPSPVATEFETAVLPDRPEEEPATLMACWPDGVDLLVVDHYGRDAGFEKACRPWAKRILVIDDLADRSHDSDFLLDQTPGRSVKDHARHVPCGCRLLLGPHYALLRPQFRAAREAVCAHRQIEPQIRHVLVSFGAADGKNMTPVALEGVRASGLDLAVDVVLGAAAHNRAQVKALAAAMPGRVSVHGRIQDMAALMTRADLAIGAAGTTSWERCCLGLPALIIVTSDNQVPIAKAVSERGAARVLGRRNTVTAEDVREALRALAEEPKSLAEMAENAAVICDGLGTRRVTAAIDPVSARDGEDIALRPATMEDAQVMLAWQRDPRTRRYFRDSEPPSREKHYGWLRERLRDRGCLLNVILHRGEPAGILRLDRLNRTAGEETYEVSILVDPARYRMGLAKGALTLVRRILPFAALQAEVLRGNHASAALFEGAGFEVSGELYVSRPPRRPRHMST